jgi:signal transduction histidine kinase
MRSLWPQSLAGRLIVWLMLVLTLALVLALALYRLSNERLLARVAKEDAVTRITMVSRILEQSGANKWQQTLHAATSDDFRFSFLEGGSPKTDDHVSAKDDHTQHGSLLPDKKQSSDDTIMQKFALIIPDVTRPGLSDDDKNVWIIERPLSGDGQLSIAEITRIKNAKRGTITLNIDDAKFQDPGFFLGKKVFPAKGNVMQGQLIRAMKESVQRENRKLQKSTVDIALKLDNGRWLKGAFKPKMQPFWSWNGALFLGLLALAIGGVIVLVVRAETRPMQRLAQAAEALGRGEHLPPLDEHGPREIRLAVEAFNLMGARLGNFVQDRTRMLAAMSHDLRTPLTTLRLRAEMIDEPEAREKLIETIEEMHRITEASLSFAREDENTEETQKIDLSALVRDLCEEANAMGKDARMETGAPTIYARVRPAAIRRALRNLIDNAVRYGEHANITMVTKDSEIRIAVEDDGPGIDEAQQEDVFAPFVRLENSRNTETGGAGLGLAIARTIARSHGGDVVLQNRKSGGLRAILSLPCKTNTDL